MRSFWSELAFIGLPRALVAGAIQNDRVNPTKSGDRQKQERAGVVLLLPASVVLGVILDRICFKALQLLRRVQWGISVGR